MSALNSLLPLDLDWPSAPTNEDDPSGMSTLTRAQYEWFARVGLQPPGQAPVNQEAEDRADDEQQ